MARLLISAGEASGDAYGAALAAELLSRRSDLTLEGVGGAKMRAVGVRLRADSSEWGAISIVQSLRLWPKIVGGYYAAKRALSGGEPGLFIPIDFGYANLRLARHAKNRGWKVLYFVPPSSWRRDRQGVDVAKLSDEIVTPFPWSAEIFRGMGASAHFFGHPIKSLRPPYVERERDAVALLPGSRLSEIELMLPLYAAAVKGLEGPFLIPVPAVQMGLARAIWKETGNDPAAVVDATAEGVAPSLARAKAAIVCSGTATLEAALARTPHVVAYRLSAAVMREVKLLRIKRPKFVALPNIVLDRVAVPELIQDEASPKALRDWLDRLIQNGEDQRLAFEELDQLLGPSDAVAKTAELALSMLPGNSR